MRSGTPEATSALAGEWLERLRPELAGYARAAMDNIGREFPSYGLGLPVADAVLLFS
jgi:hypothetical protein